MLYIHVRYGDYELFTYRYGYVYFTYFEWLCYNETYKILRDFTIQMDHQISTRHRADKQKIKKWTFELSSIGFFYTDGPQSENKRKGKGRKILGTCQRTKKKTMARKGDVDTNCSWCTWNGPQDWKGDWNSWKSEEESKTFEPQHCWDRPEYWEECWKPKETCCHSGSRESPTANTCVKNSQELIIITITNK